MICRTTGAGSPVVTDLVSPRNHPFLVKNAIAPRFRESVNPSEGFPLSVLTCMRLDLPFAYESFLCHLPSLSYESIGGRIVGLSNPGQESVLNIGG